MISGIHRRLGEMNTSPADKFLYSGIKESRH